MTRDYSDYPVLSNLYLEDSYVLDVIERPTEVVFVLEAVLTPEHPRYRAPGAREQHCYVRGNLVFVKVSRVEWLERSFQKYKDASGSEDLGNVDVLTNTDGMYYMEGDWGKVRIWSNDDPQFEFSEKP
ncbi:hypothetical protein ABZW96_18610 [Nocardia sp. NPDC004168]|uniref:hypothetical protein n=1 Tax=Nocardia sp. NPDC004168 TaxID=3154452 RepID=UPI0033AE0808